MGPQVNLHEIQTAAERIAPYVVQTPLVFSERLSEQLSCRIYFKTENLQHVGAFKARGATNAVMQLEPHIASRGVVTHSSGNHAAALARAARLRRIPAFVVMPENSAKIKIDAVRSYGVEPVFCEPTAQSREETASTLQSQTGATLIHPYDHPAVIAGQGTVGLEVITQLPDVDVICVPVGGGGLLSGVLTAVKSLRPQIDVIAAEPEWADDAARSLSSGRIEMPTRYDTVADGLRTPLGHHTFPIIQELLDGIILVTEASIRQAVAAIMQTVHLVVEPSGAVGLAAIQTQPQRFANKSVVVVISGGNLDFTAWQFATE